MKYVELDAIEYDESDIEKIKEAILDLLKREIYYPIMAELGTNKRVMMENSEDDLMKAIQTGKISYYRGGFTGSFNSSLSKDLRAIGAKFDSRSSSWKIRMSDLSAELKTSVMISNNRLLRTLDNIQRKLDGIIPADLAAKLKIDKLFDSTIWKTEQKFKKSVKNLTVEVQMSKGQKEKLAEDYTNNLNLYIQKFTEEETAKLRKDIQKSAFSGNRYESMIKDIQKSYKVSENKAKFLAKQETNILMAKYAESRYKDAGVTEYVWQCAAGSPKHPVRPMHKALNQTVQRYDDPPIVNVKGEHKNPGEDYGCRCVAKPIVKFS